MFRVFTHEKYGTLRAHVYKEKLWFVAADLAELLGHEDTQTLTAEYVFYSDKGITPLDTNEYILTISECGAYSLICGLRNSRTNEVLHWLVNDVIPELRQVVKPITNIIDVTDITAAPMGDKDDFSMLTSAIKKHYGEPKAYHFSNEYNMLNKLVLGMTAKDYRKTHDIKSGKSIRPYLTSEELRLLEMLEVVDIGFIAANLSFNERKEKLTVFMNKYAP